MASSKRVNKTRAQMWLASACGESVESIAEFHRKTPRSVAQMIHNAEKAINIAAGAWLKTIADRDWRSIERLRLRNRPTLSVGMEIEIFWPVGWWVPALIEWFSEKLIVVKIGPLPGWQITWSVDIDSYGKTWRRVNSHIGVPP